MREVPQTTFLYQSPVLKLLRGLLAKGEQSWNGLDNVLKDEINLNSFKSALSLSGTRDCLEGVEIEFYFSYLMYP